MMNTIIRIVKDMNFAADIADYTDLIEAQIIDADSMPVLLETLDKEFDSYISLESITIENVKTPLDIYDVFSGLGFIE